MENSNLLNNECFKCTLSVLLILVDFYMNKSSVLGLSAVMEFFGVFLLPLEET